MLDGFKEQYIENISDFILDRIISKYDQLEDIKEKRTLTDSISSKLEE